MAFKIFKGEVDLNPPDFFLRPPRAELRGYTYRLLQGPSRLRHRSGALFVRVVKQTVNGPKSFLQHPFIVFFLYIVTTG